MNALLVLLPIFGIATIFNIKFKKNISVSVFFSITFIITIMFIFGISNFLQLGLYTLFYGGIIALVVMSIFYKKEVLNNLLSVPIVIYTLISILYLYFMQDAQFFFWDEYSHWGKFIKYIYYTNELYDLNTSASHLNYPPGISLWDYFVVKFFEYKDANVYFAYFLFIFSSILMMYEKLRFRDIHWIILVFVIQIVIFSSFGHWFSCIYVDHVIGAVFIGIVLSYLSDKYTDKELLLFIFPMVSLVLVKEIGLYFGLSAIGFIYIYKIIIELEEEKKLLKVIKKNIQAFVILLFIFIITFLTLKVWVIHQESKGIVQEGQTLSTVAKNIFSNKHILDLKIEEKIKSNLNYVIEHQQLHKEKISLNYNEFSFYIMKKYKKNIKLTAITILVFFSLVILLSYKFTKDKRNLIAFTGIYFLVITMIYIFFILYQSYLVAFGNDALRVPSYVRYVNIAILPLMFMMFSIFLPIFQKKCMKNFLMASLILIILSSITRPYLLPLYSQFKNSTRINIDDLASGIVKKIPLKSKLFVIFPIKNNGSLNNMLGYSLIPISFKISKYNFENKSFEEMKKKYSKYDYIWFAKLDKRLFEKNRSILKMKSKKIIYTLYQVKVSNMKLSFIPVK